MHHSSAGFLCALLPTALALSCGLTPDGPNTSSTSSAPQRDSAGREESEVRSAPLPNVIFIMADDMGFGDVRALNPDSVIPTPNIDRIASEGMRFTDAHTPSSVCTPTRYGVLTGRYCWRGTLKRGVINGYGAPVIERERKTVAHLMASAGYHTAVIGKWHLGLDWPKVDGTIDFEQHVGGGPLAFGFDQSYIIPASLDFPPYVYLRDGWVTDSVMEEQASQSFPAFLRKGPRARDLRMDETLDHLTERATETIARLAQSEQPFFLYFPLSAPHKPLLPHPRFRGRTAAGEYGDFIAQVDWTVGRVLAALDQADCVQNTIVIYTSDNGSYMHRLDDPQQEDHVDNASIQGFRPEHHKANGDLRGTKADIYEGGHRVPFLMRWPGEVRAGSTCAQTICLTDLMASCAELVGAELSADMGEDSFSFLPLARGEQPRLPRPPVIHHSVSGMFAIRSGNWKLVAGNGSGGRQKPRGKAFEEPYQLYDLAVDPGEETNVIVEENAVDVELRAALQLIRESGHSRMDQR